MEAGLPDMDGADVVRGSRTTDARARLETPAHRIRAAQTAVPLEKVTRQ
jgi:hypothetical protein